MQDKAEQERILKNLAWLKDREEFKTFCAEVQRVAATYSFKGNSIRTPDQALDATTRAIFGNGMLEALKLIDRAPQKLNDLTQPEQ